MNKKVFLSYLFTHLNEMQSYNREVPLIKYQIKRKKYMLIPGAINVAFYVMCIRRLSLNCYAQIM